MRAIAIAGIVLLGATPVLAHSWYTGQKNAQGSSCCGGRDCGPVNPAAVRMIAPDHWQVTLDPGDIGTYPEGEPIELEFRGNPGISPDGQIHACATKADIDRGTVRCLFVGGGV